MLTAWQTLRKRALLLQDRGRACAVELITQRGIVPFTKSGAFHESGGRCHPNEIRVVTGHATVSMSSA